MLFPSGDDTKTESPALPGVPVHAASAVTFEDLDAGSGEVAGLLSITKATDESDVTHYVLRWGTGSGVKLVGAPAIAEFAATGSDHTRFFPPDTIIPSGATCFVVYTKNSAGEMTSGASCALSDLSGAVYSGSEGSKTAPVFLESSIGGITYTKQIGKGKSYYYMTAAGTFLGVNLTGLSDDVDLIGYGNDSTFTTEESRSSYGRRANESLYGSGPGYYYFVVDGGPTGHKLNAAGAVFKVTVWSHSGATSGTWPNEGTAEEPADLVEGEVDFGSVNTESYYRVPVTRGSAYYVNTSAGVTAEVYTDTFMTSVSSPPVTATGSFLYLKAMGSNTGFRIEVVRDEGTERIPVYL